MINLKQLSLVRLQLLVEGERAFRAWHQGSLESRERRRARRGQLRRREAAEKMTAVSCDAGISFLRSVHSGARSCFWAWGKGVAGH
jgi:hypothetical protein